MLDKEDSQYSPNTALEAFNTISDELLIDMIRYDRSCLYMMCLALGVGFFEKENLAT
jgi:hypothetical protein